MESVSIIPDGVHILADLHILSLGNTSYIQSEVLQTYLYDLGLETYLDGFPPDTLHAYTINDVVYYPLRQAFTTLGFTITSIY